MADMEAELGKGNKMAGILPRLAQYELTLLDWAEAHKGSRKYVVFANKCWPAFQTQFGFVPCYVNSRLTKIGIPVACEVDIYGAVSEYIGVCVSQKLLRSLTSTTLFLRTYTMMILQESSLTHIRIHSWASTAETQLHAL